MTYDEAELFWYIVKKVFLDVNLWMIHVWKWNLKNTAGQKLTFWKNISVLFQIVVAFLGINKPIESK